MSTSSKNLSFWSSKKLSQIFTFHHQVYIHSLFWIQSIMELVHYK